MVLSVGGIPTIPGTTWFPQSWYRDPLMTGVGSNFTDAVVITFV